MREFVDLKEIYANEILDSENYQILYLYNSQSEIEELKKTHFCKPWYTEGLKHGVPYVTLFKKGQKAMMSDVPMEKITNQDFINKANGNVFIGGLGIGLIVFPLLRDKDIKSVTIMELDEGLISILEPIFKKHDPDNKLTIIHGNVFESNDLIGDKKFDSIYFDIWISIMADNFKEMETLHFLYAKNLNTNNLKSFIDSWCFEYCKKIHFQTEDFKKYIQQQFPNKTVDIEREILFLNGAPVEGLMITDNYLNSKHRYSIDYLV